MHKDFLKELNCPNCQSSKLVLLDIDESVAFINDGNISCRDCKYNINILNGIPRFISTKNYADSFGFQWNIHAKTQLDSYSKLSISHDRLFNVTGWSKELSGEQILEVGSGAGRFTEILINTGADVTSFDYSNAVDANYANNFQQGKLNLFQGDILNLPLRKNSYDKLLCLGVLQHTPDPKISFQKIIKMVRPGGSVVIDIYKKIFYRIFNINIY